MILDQLNTALEQLTDAQVREQLARLPGERLRARTARESAEFAVQVERENAAELFAEMLIYAMQTDGVAAVVANQIDKLIPWEQIHTLEDAFRAVRKENEWLRIENWELAGAVNALREQLDRMEYESHEAANHPGPAQGEQQRHGTPPQRTD